MSIRPAIGRRMRLVEDWLLVVTPKTEAAFQLVCFPHAGGDVTSFVPLALALEPRVELWAVRLLGRGGRFRDPMPPDFDSLIDSLVAALSPHLRHPCGFYGQSLGALLAFEASRRLPAECQPAVAVVASALPPSRWPTGLADTEVGAARLLQASGLAEAVSASPELRSVVLRTIQADLALGRSVRYRSAPVSDIALHAVVGCDDPMVTCEDMDGWSEHTRGEFHRSVVVGGHLLANAVSTGPVELLKSVVASYSPSGWSTDVAAER